MAPDAGATTAPPSLTRLIVAASLGNALEFYEILVYGYFAVTVSHAFFPTANPVVSLLAFILSGIVHMEFGMRSIIVDYINGQSRAWALAANTLFAALLALACVYATLRIAFT